MRGLQQICNISLGVQRANKVNLTEGNVRAHDAGTYAPKVVQCPAPSSQLLCDGRVPLEPASRANSRGDAARIAARTYHSERVFRWKVATALVLLQRTRACSMSRTPRCRFKMTNEARHLSAAVAADAGGLFIRKTPSSEKRSTKTIAPIEHYVSFPLEQQHARQQHLIKGDLNRIDPEPMRSVPPKCDATSQHDIHCSRHTGPVADEYLARAAGHGAYLARGAGHGGVRGEEGAQHRAVTVASEEDDAWQCRASMDDLEACGHAASAQRSSEPKTGSQSCPPREIPLQTAADACRMRFSMLRDSSFRSRCPSQSSWVP